MFRKTIQNIDCHNPFARTSRDRKLFILAEFLVLAYSINIHAYAITSIVTIHIILDFALHIYFACGNIKFIWSLFIGTKLRTNLQTHYYLRNSPFNSELSKERYLECVSWLDTIVRSPYYLLTPGDYIVFFWKSDAVWFKMIWGGEEGFVLPPIEGEEVWPQ